MRIQGWDFWAYAIGLVVLCFVLFFIATRERSIERAAGSLAKGVGQLPPEELRDPTRVRLRMRAVGGLVGSLVGATIALLVVAQLESQGSIVSYFPIASVIFGNVYGNAIGGLVGELRQPRSGVRVARLRAVELSDYLPLRLRIMPPICVALTVAVVVLTATFLPVGGVSTYVRPELPAIRAAILGLAVESVAGLLIWWVGASCIVRTRQPAESSSELSWLDALRADSLYLLAGGTFVGPLYCLTSLYFAVDLVGNWERGVVPFEFGVICVGAALIGLAIVGFSRHPRRRYITTLWPDLLPEAAKQGISSPEAVGAK